MKQPLKSGFFMYKVYILYSVKIDFYYVGQSENLDNRFDWHKEKVFKRSFSKRADDWIIFLTIDCISRKQAVNIEMHIKKMKSGKYIENLKIYPEMVENLKLKYS